MAGAAKHTAGPWRAKDRTIMNANGVKIATATVHSGGKNFKPDEMAESNARLIAAVPELLAALESIIDLTKPGQTVNISQATDIICDVWNVARAALSKAEGGAS